MIELIKQNKNKLTCILIAFVTIIAIVLLLLGSQSYTTNTDDDSSIDSYKVLYEEAKMNYECKIGIREWPAGVMQDPKMTAKDYEAKMNYYEELMDNNISKSDYFNIDNPLQNKETMRHATIGYMMLYIMSFFVIVAALSIPYVFAKDDGHSKLVALGASYGSVFVLNLIVFIFGIPFVLNNMSAPVIQQFGINTITTTISIYYFVRALGLLCISLLMCTIGSIIANARKMSFAKYLSVFMTYFIFCIPFVLELGLKSNNYAIIPITHIQFASNIINNPIYWIGVIICIMLGMCYYACLRFRKQL